MRASLGALVALLVAPCASLRLGLQRRAVLAGVPALLLGGASAASAAPRYGGTAPQLKGDYANEIFSTNGCAKRGPLGKCEDEGGTVSATEEREELQRAAQSGREKAAKYMADEEEANTASPLIMRLREQTAANKVKNQKKVDEEMFMNSQSGDFGPFSRYMLVEKPDGKYVMMPKSRGDKMKKDQLVVDQKFVDAAALAKYISIYGAEPEPTVRAPTGETTTREPTEVDKELARLAAL